jgi:hypothetical protein
VSNPNARFAVDVDFSSLVLPGNAGYPPAGSPKKELLASAYIENGGPIDPSFWRYYENFQGTLTGEGDFDGGVLDVSRVGPAFQVGIGANGKNVNLGASGWMNFAVTAQPNLGGPWTGGSDGDFNIDLACYDTRCARAANGDSYAATISGHALWLPGISHCTMDPGSLFVENSNGTAKLTGTATAMTNPTAQFLVDIDFSQRTNPGDPGYLPAGSPKLELALSAYLQFGGFIDPLTWYYYEEFHGTLIGLGDFAGGQVSVVNTGGAFQVGIGANGKNTNPGASGWMTVTVDSQPSTSFQWPNPGNLGDLNLDLLTDCSASDHVSAMTATVYGNGCAAPGAQPPTLAVNGSLQPGTIATLSLTQANPNAAALLLFGLSQGNQFVGFGGCYLLVQPLVAIYGPFNTDANGVLDLSMQLPLSMAPATLCLQYAVDPSNSNFAMSNGATITVQ